MMGKTEANTQTATLAVSDDVASFRESPVARAIWSFFGFVLMAMAVGLWLVPGAGGDVAFVLIKLVASLCFFVVGLAVSRLGRRANTFEVQLDRQKGELRLIERGPDGVSRKRESLTYGEMSRVELEDGTLRVMGHEGKALIELPLAMIDNRREFEDAVSQGMARTA